MSALERWFRVVFHVFSPYTIHIHRVSLNPPLDRSHFYYHTSLSPFCFTSMFFFTFSFFFLSFSSSTHSQPIEYQYLNEKARANEITGKVRRCHFALFFLFLFLLFSRSCVFFLFFFIYIYIIIFCSSNIYIFSILCVCILSIVTSLFNVIFLLQKFLLLFFLFQHFFFIYKFV